MIAPASFELLNKTNYDIFRYFREGYSVTNLHEEGIVTITASSTVDPSGEMNRTNASILISEANGGRWVSTSQNTRYLIIDFHKNSVDLIGYFFLTNVGVRFIDSWEIYGVFGNKYYLLDQRVETPLCTTENGNCKEFNNLFFRTQRSGNFHKFIIVNKKPDSYGEYIFSLSNIQFYGAVNSYFIFNTYGITYQMSFLRCLRYFIVFFSELT